MTVFTHSSISGGAPAGCPKVAGRQQVWPVDCDAADSSQLLVEASHRGDLQAASDLLSGGTPLDVNYAGTVRLKFRRAEVTLHEESPDEVSVHYDELTTDASPLFLAAHSGDLPLVRKLLSVGADVNQKLFPGYATTAAVREGWVDVLVLLLKAGAAQPACEEALIEAAAHGRAWLAELLMGSDLIRPNVAVHALAIACSRGFVEVVGALIKCGVDSNATDRILVRSLKPSLHTNVDCTMLMAAIVSRQITVVRHLLQVGVRDDTMVRLGAWTWDIATGGEFRVGAGLAEPYSAAWCAVEYFESSGTILRMLLNKYSLSTLHYGRNLLHYAILCANPSAVSVLLAAGADCEFPVRTTRKHHFRPIHMVARLGNPAVLQRLIDARCDIDSRTESGETALMLCVRYKNDSCLRILASIGADLGLVSLPGASALSIASSNGWTMCFQHAILDVIKSGKVPLSSSPNVFSPLMFAARCGDVRALEVLLAQPEVDIDAQDEAGFSPVMVAAEEGHVDAFRYLVFTGANVKLCNKSGETAINLSQSSSKSDLFEQVMLEFALQKGSPGGFYALHCAARRGDLTAVRLLSSGGYDVNLPDGEGYTPLMLAAREGHSVLCELLISFGAQCDLKNQMGETALLLARKNAEFGNKAEGVILDELARVLVLEGASVKKHTKCGKGWPHRKTLQIVGAAGVLRWGKSRRRNVVCREAEVGGSSRFQRNRRRKADAHQPGLFGVVTTKGKEFYFVCDGGEEMAELWVRGIRLMAMEGSGSLL